jgi:hypothetical protein
MLRCVDPSITSVAYKDALASEAAAFTHAELSSGLAAAGLGGVQYGFARPLPYLQAYWMRAAGAKASASLGRHTGCRAPARRDAALLRWGFTTKPF